MGSRSISEQWGRHVDDRFQVRVLQWGWLVPGLALTAIGVSALTGRDRLGPIVSGRAPVELLERVQAGVVLLAVLHFLLTVRCAVLRVPAEPFRPAKRGILPACLACLGLAAGATIGAAASVEARPVLVPVVAVAAFATATAASLCLYRLPGVRLSPLVAMSVAISGQLTIGWLPIVEPELASSPIPVLSGIALMAAAVGVARGVPFVAATTLDLDALDRELDEPVEASGAASVSVS